VEQRPHSGATERRNRDLHIDPTSSMTLRPAWSSRALHWTLRIGVAMCFIGHGAFGIRVKEAWIPFFQALGFSSPVAHRLMPIVGTFDITMGIIALLSPCRAVLLWMSCWALFTAFLRPLAGQGYWEVLERAGNYGVPMTFLALSGLGRSWREWFEPIMPGDTPAAHGVSLEAAGRMLRITTALLLLGHAGYGAFMHKAMLQNQYMALGVSAQGAAAAVSTVGWIEVLLALGILAAPVPALLLFVFVWKIGTELLYPMSGDPIWEFVERGGSYVAPIGLLLIGTGRREPVPVPEIAPASIEESLA
jgi:hypothetical protein